MYCLEFSRVRHTIKNANVESIDQSINQSIFTYMKCTQRNKIKFG